jgi:hypothetical protein
MLYEPGGEGRSSDVLKELDAIVEDEHCPGFLDERRVENGCNEISWFDKIVDFICGSSELEFCDVI